MAGFLPPRFDAAARFAGPLLGAAGAALGLALVTLVGQHGLDYGALAPLAVYMLLLAVTLYTSGRVARLRSEVQRTRDAEEPEGPAGEPEGRSTPAAQAQAKLARYGREGVALMFSLGGAAGLGLSVLSLRGDLGSGPAARITVLVGLVLGLLAFLLMVASRWTALTSPRLPESAGLVEWLRGGHWVSALTGVGLLARGLGLEAFDLGRGIALVLVGVCTLCAAELWLRGLFHAFRNRAPWPEIVVPVQLITLTTLFHGGSPLHSLMAAAERRLGLSLRSTWAIGFVRRSLGMLLASLILLVWASTMLVVIGPQEQGIRLRFGRLVSRAPVSPGLHLKWPWPLETMDRYPVTRVQTLGLGYAGPPKDSLLWGRTHAGEEYQLLLGEGRELVSVDATVSYRIRDVVAFAFGSQNPRETLDALAYRLLMRETVATDLDRLLTADRTEFAKRFAVTLQQACDVQGLGLAILHVGFISLHPPVGIAGAYEDVVSAEIERETRAARGRVYQETTAPAAQAEATRAIREAEAEAARRLADAEGAAARFRAALSASRTSPELFRFRRRLEALEDGLADRSLFVVDHRLRTGAGELWIDIRPGTQTP
ncbi:MAG TPA: protease modulator HflK [Methylomirabilota bacterium]|nr:protease modulator HflK [Methylomirabilota bacterium]